jgi:phosphoribosylaminoimidazolecarboxamide formyltransferase/IMP cyclohydrolase
VLGGLLVQDRDWDVADREGCRSWPGALGDDLGRHALRLARVQARGVERDRDRQGPADDRDRGGSDESRRRGPDRRREGDDLGHSLDGAVLASDAFFPFPDGPRLALDAGVSALIQPGGSKRRLRRRRAVEGAGASMVFTGAALPPLS